MTSTAFVSACGAPGVTTTACAIGAVWPTQAEAVLVECDPSGGDLVIRFGLPKEPGLATFVLDHRASGSRQTRILEHAQVLPGGLKVVVGPIGPDTSVALDRELERSDEFFEGHRTDLVVDCGRFNPQSGGQQRVLTESDSVVIVGRCDASSVAHGRWLFDALSELRCGGQGPAQILLIGDGPFTPGEYAGAMGGELIGTLPFDPEAAQMLGGEPGRRRALVRSPLVGAARRIGVSLAVLGREAELVDAG